MSQSLIIIGTGGSAYDVLDVVEAINAVRPTWQVAGFLDDARPTGGEYLGHPILGRLADVHRFERHQFVSVIGSDKSFRRRPEILGSTGLPPARFATLVHPAAAVSSRARVGHGSYVNCGASVAGGVTIGHQVSIGPGCIIGHDGVLADYAMVAPGAIVSGFCRLGRGCYVGAGAVVRQRIVIGDGALVGMGAVVVKDVVDGTTVVGNPARPIVRAAGSPL